MPKRGLSASQWITRLTEYAWGRFKFGPGQSPRPNTRWYMDVQKIGNCPLFTAGSSGSRDPFGNELKCTCSYHKPKPERKVSSQPQPMAVRAWRASNVPATQSSPPPAADDLDSSAAPTSSATTPKRASSTSERSPSGSSAASKPVVTKDASELTSTKPSHARTGPTSGSIQDIISRVLKSKGEHVTQSAQGEISSDERLAPQPRVPPASATSSKKSAHHPRIQAASQSSSGEKSAPQPEIQPAPPSSSGGKSAPKPSIPLPSTADVPVGVTAAAQPQRTVPVAGLPTGWRSKMSEHMLKWLAPRILDPNGKIKQHIPDLWFYPPPPPKVGVNPPIPERYFTKRFFLWIPRRLWGIQLHCVSCPGKCLTSKGLYRNIREVTDLSATYLMASEYYECKSCSHTYIAWSKDILDQLDPGHRNVFPVVFTYKKACDRRVITLLRSRTLGNSSTALQHSLEELHSEEWLRTALLYLTDCEQHRRRVATGIATAREITYAVPPKYMAVGSQSWVLSSYRQDALRRVDETKAQITSVYGNVLKVDSTKKITKKLSGHVAGTASWATNVGNEYGQVLMSVLTTDEGEGLKDMSQGLVRRYLEAREQPPALLYVDRDCCTGSGHSKYLDLFSPWQITVRLDTWHFMRRFALGCTTESHPLYGAFMSRLSACIFKWDQTDIGVLKSAKEAELKATGINRPTEKQLHDAISKREMALHCRRATRGVGETRKEIHSLISAMLPLTDACGVPVLDKDRIYAIFETQSRHIPCIQDPEGVPLYIKRGTVTKHGVELPLYRCSRGSTSLESFHLHLNRFIPGERASDVNFQVYLLEGLARWNADRAAAATQMQPSRIRSFDTRLKNAVNTLSGDILGESVFEEYRPPGKYTGELIGVEYLLRDTTKLDYSAAAVDDDMVSQEAELEEVDDRTIAYAEDLGFFDRPDAISSHDSSVPASEGPAHDSKDAAKGQGHRSRPPQKRIPESRHSDSTSTTHSPSRSQQISDSSDSDTISYGSDDEDDAVDSRGVAGWGRVAALVDFLLHIEGWVISNKDVARVIALHAKLHDFDRARTNFQLRARRRLLDGRFAVKRKSSVTPGVESTRRAFIGEGVPAQKPTVNRIVEALCLRLTEKHRSPQKKGKALATTRWNCILQEYNRVREKVCSNDTIMSATTLCLPAINRTTLRGWYQDRERCDEVRSLLQGSALPPVRQVATQPLPQPVDRPLVPPTRGHPVHSFAEPANKAGEDVVGKRKKYVTPSVRETSANSIVYVLNPSGPSTSVPNSSLLNPPVYVPVATREATVRIASKKPVVHKAAAPKIDQPAQSRTTEWYHRKSAFEDKEREQSGEPPRKRNRKLKAFYACKKCGEHKSKDTGHTQYKGRWYCPNEEGAPSLEVWKEKMKSK